MMNLMLMMMVKMEIDIEDDDKNEDGDKDEDDDNCIVVSRACEVCRSDHIMLIILILTSSSFCPIYDLVHLRQKSFRSSVSSARNSVWSSLLLGDWDFQVGNICGVTICLCL